MRTKLMLTLAALMTLPIQTALAQSTDHPGYGHGFWGGHSGGWSVDCANAVWIGSVMSAASVSMSLVRIDQLPSIICRDFWKSGTHIGDYLPNLVPTERILEGGHVGVERSAAL